MEVNSENKTRLSGEPAVSEERVSPWVGTTVPEFLKQGFCKKGESVHRNRSSVPDIYKPLKLSQ